MKAEQFDKAFDDGEDIDSAIDWDLAKRPGQKVIRTSGDFPEWMIKGLDKEASRLGIARQALIKVWLAERLDRQDEKRRSAL